MMSIENNYQGLNISKQEVKVHQNEGQKAFLNYWTVIVKGKKYFKKRQPYSANVFHIKSTKE